MTGTPSIATIAIRPSRECPAVEPVEGPYTFQGQSYGVARLQIVGRALDAKVFCQSEFEDYCKPAWAASFPAVNTCLTASQTGTAMTLPERLPERKALIEEFKMRLKAAPRGAWALFRRDWDNGQRQGTTWVALFAEGEGMASTVNMTGVQEHPDFALIEDRQVRMEIYHARCAEEDRRERARSRSILNARAWRPGDVLKNVRVGGNRYSTAVVAGISSDGSKIELTCTKRGSRNRFVHNVLAQRLTLQGELDALPAYGAKVASFEPASPGS